MNPRLERLAYLFGDDAIRILQNSTVAVIGIGGVGGVAAESLIRSGIGHLIVMDYDVVHISNTNRQIMADSMSVGKYKVDVLEKRLQSIAPDAKITSLKERFTESTKELLFSLQPDYIIDAIDSISDKFLLIQEASRREIAIVSSMGAAKKTSPLGLEVSTLDKTTYDPIAKILRKKMREAGLSLKVPVVFSKETPKDIPNLGSYMNVTASFGLVASHVAVQTLLKKGGIPDVIR